jgi:hypothetical protein
VRTFGGALLNESSAPKGAIIFEGLAVSLKRYPDTKPEFFRSV